jgi:hypothetical protein
MNTNRLSRSFRRIALATPLVFAYPGGARTLPIFTYTGPEFALFSLGPALAAAGQRRLHTRGRPTCCRAGNSDSRSAVMDLTQVNSRRAQAG